MWVPVFLFPSPRPLFASGCWQCRLWPGRCGWSVAHRPQNTARHHRSSWWPNNLEITNDKRCLSGFSDFLVWRRTMGVGPDPWLLQTVHIPHKSPWSTAQAQCQEPRNTRKHIRSDYHNDLITPSYGSLYSYKVALWWRSCPSHPWLLVLLRGCLLHWTFPW